MEDQLLQAISHLSKMMEVTTLAVDKVDKRLTAIEQEQQLLRKEITEQRGQLTKVQSDQENIVIPRLGLLYEGHTTLLHQLEGRAENERLEEAESNIRLHADVIKHMNQDMQEIKVDIVKIKADISGFKQA